MGIFLLSVRLLNSTGLCLGTLVFLVIFWIVGMELGLLSDFLEGLVRRTMARHHDRLYRRWFAERDEEKQEKPDEHARGNTHQPGSR